MSILISQTRPLASGQNGHVSGAAKAAREDGRAVGIRLRAQDDAHAVGALLELRELEQYVACRVTGAVRTGQAARARGPRDRYLVRESLIGAHDEGARQRLERRARTDDMVGMPPLGRLPVTRLVRQDRVLHGVER